MERDMKAEFKRLKTRERLCAKTLKGRALLVIDHILTNLESEDELLSKLYKIAHCATGVCSNKHEDWIAELEEAYKEADNGK